MANTVRYLRLRDGVYQYERRVPVRVKLRADEYAREFASRSLFRRSLRTKSQATACMAAAITEREFDARVRRALAVLPLDKSVLTKPRRVTEHDLDLIEAECFENDTHPFEQLMLRADTDRASAEELERMFYELGMEAPGIIRAVETPGFTSNKAAIDPPLDRARGFIRNLRLDAPPKSEAEAQIILRVRQAMRRSFNMIGRLESGDAVPRLNPAQPATKVHTIRGAVEAYLSERKLPARTRREVKGALQDFERFIGNKSLDGITKADFRKFARDLGSRIVGGKSKGSIERPVSPATVKKKISLLRSAIHHSEQTGLWEGINPAAGIDLIHHTKVPDLSVMREKRAWSIGEQNRIFASRWFNPDLRPADPNRLAAWLDSPYYWAPVVAAWTGCRAAELGGLRLAEVLIDDLFPHFLIEENAYRTIKKGYLREVPILDALLELGFAEYVSRIRTRGEDRLFPDWKPKLMNGQFVKDEASWSDGSIPRWFNRTLLKNVFGVSPTRRPSTFHGYRGACKQMLGVHDRSLSGDTINQIIGHAMTGDNKSYFKAPMHEIYPLVRKACYPGLIIPPRLETI